MTPVEQAALDYFGSENLDLRDRVAALAACIAELEAAVVEQGIALWSAQEDRCAYRDSLQETLALLHDERSAHKRLKESHQRLLDQYRALRVHEMRRAA